MRVRALLLVLGITSYSIAAQPLRLLTWNVQSGGSDPAVIAEQLAALDRYHIYGLCSVDPAAASRYAKSLGKQYKSFVSNTGGKDRLMMIYNTERLDLLENAELDAHDGVRMNDVNFRHRSPLLGRFRDLGTDAEFLVVLNHLARVDVELRQEQAKALRLWVEDQTLPVIGLGDYNFDFDLQTLRGNAAFDEFMLDYRWRWVRPQDLIDTNWADRDGDGHDDDPNLCLDFAFVGAAAYNREAHSRVIVRPGDFPDDDKSSDHRPIELVVSLLVE